MFVIRRLVWAFNILRVFIFPMDCLWMTLTSTLMVVRVLVCHPFYLSVVINGSYLLCLWSMAWHGYWSWQYVNSMNYSVRSGVGVIVVGVWLGASRMHSMSGLNFARNLAL